MTTMTRGWMDIGDGCCLSSDGVNLGDDEIVVGMRPDFSPCPFALTVERPNGERFRIRFPKNGGRCAALAMAKGLADLGRHYGIFLDGFGIVEMDGPDGMGNAGRISYGPRAGVRVIF